ncbi:MAG TPA: LCP family protein [Acidimicrobiia bacterium]|jgi:LCP family protein required for cell wall assembly
MGPRRSPLRAFAGRYAVAFGVATLFMAGAVVTVNYIIDEKIDSIDRVDVTVANAPPQGANYLLIGSDTRAFVDTGAEQEAFGNQQETGGQRSDTMMVLHVEPDRQRTLAVSFPRDLWVNIPGAGASKINAAFNDGGPDKAIETLKSNFGIQINHYLEVDFKTFRGIVDAIGTVPVYFPYAARDQKTGLYITLPGCLRLDGTSALSYVRSRSLEYYSNTRKRWMNADNTPDIDRIARQQDFMRRLAGLAVQKSLNNPLTANDIADRVLENLKIDDNLTKDDIFDLIDAFRTINPNDQSALEFQTLPWKQGPDQKGQSVLYPDEPKASEMVARLNDFSDHGAGSTATVAPSKVKVRVLNGTGLEGAASAVRDRLVELGFVDGGTADDGRGTVAQTEIRYKPGELDKAKTVFRAVNPDARLVEDETLERADVAVVVGVNFQSVVAPSATTTTTAPSVAPTTTASAPSSPTTASRSSTPTTTPVDTKAGTPVAIPNQSQLGTPAPKSPPC